MFAPALLLNADYRPLSYYPLSLLDWERTIKAVVEKTVAVVSEYDTLIRSPSTTMRLPSVVALRQYKPAKHHLAFTRFNLFLRDGFTCQYCSGKFRTQELTFDHVTPRAKGGQTTWENITTACVDCNSKKDVQAMSPKTIPKKPTVGDLARAQRKFPPRYLHESWIDWMYWDTVIER